MRTYALSCYEVRTWHLPDSSFSSAEGALDFPHVLLEAKISRITPAATL